jgi:hypothetical protein
VLVFHELKSNFMRIHAMLNAFTISSRFEMNNGQVAANYLLFASFQRLHILVVVALLLQGFYGLMDPSMQRMLVLVALPSSSNN